VQLKNKDPFLRDSLPLTMDEDLIITRISIFLKDHTLVAGGIILSNNVAGKFKL
jgi:hypothetical protein